MVSGASHLGLFDEAAGRAAPSCNHRRRRGLGGGNRRIRLLVRDQRGSCLHVAADCLRRPTSGGGWTGRLGLAGPVRRSRLVARPDGSRVAVGARRRDPGADRRQDRVQSTERFRCRRGHRDRAPRRRRRLGRVGLWTVRRLGWTEHRRTGLHGFNWRCVGSGLGRAGDATDSLGCDPRRAGDRCRSPAAARNLERL